MFNTTSTAGERDHHQQQRRHNLFLRQQRRQRAADRQCRRQVRLLVPDIAGTTAGSIEGAGRFNLGSNTLTVGGNDLSTTVSGVIADGGISGGTGGALVKIGNGTLTLTGANTYTGGTTINGGTLQIGDSTHTGKILGAVTNNTIFELVNADTSGITSIANSHTMQVRNSTSLGNIAITNSGYAIEFHNTSSAGSATITSTGGGGAAFFDASTAGNSTITGTGSNTFLGTSNAGSAIINGTGSISFLGGSSAANANITISGTGGGFFNGTATAGNATITFSGSSNLTFVDTSTAGSAHITNNRSMGFFFDSTAANAVITNTGGADLRFSNTTTASNATIINSGTVNFYNTASGGNARLIANAGGVFDFSSLTSAGTTAGSFEGAGSFRLGSRTLTIGGNGLSTNVTGVIADGGAGGGTGGALVKTGTGTMTLSGTNTYTGATTVDGGTLAVNGSITASSGVTVNNGGTLAGIGTVGNTTVNSGGTLASGNGTAGSSMNVTGSLAFQSGAFYMVQLNPATSSSTFVTGAATLGGSTVKAIYANGSYLPKQYTILTAASVSGTFASVAETNLPSNVHATLSYDATHAYLNLVLSFIPPPGSGLSGNQNAVGNSIVNYFNSNGGIPIIYSALTAGGLTQASGETAAGSQATTFQAMNQFMGVDDRSVRAGPRRMARGKRARRMPSDEEALTPMPTCCKRAGQCARRLCRDLQQGAAGANLGSALERVGGRLWRLADHRRQCGTRNRTTRTSRLFGIAAGADYCFSPNTVAGFALAGGGTNFSVANGGSGRSDLFQAGAFVRHTIGAAYLSGALAYGWQDVTTDRTVTIAGIDRLRAQFNANAYLGPRRRRLSLRHAMDRRRRHHALCGGTVHHLRPARLCRTGGLRRQHLRACLWLEERHRHPQRTWPARRQILRHAERHPHLARPRRMGARFQSGPRCRRDLPGAARRELRRQRRKAGQRLRAHHGLRRDEMDQRLVDGRHLRRRVLQCHALLRRQGCRPLCMVSTRSIAIRDQRPAARLLPLTALTCGSKTRRRPVWPAMTSSGRHQAIADWHPWWKPASPTSRRRWRMVTRRDPCRWSRRWRSWR